MASDSADLSAQQVTNATFETKRRGFDQAAVKAHLAAAGSTVAQLHAQVAALESKIDELNAQVESAKLAAESAAQDPITLDEDELAERVGQDAARVLSDARAAATDRLVEAESEREKILAAAEAIFAERSIAADEQAARIRAQAEVEAGDRAIEATAAAALIVSNAEADVEAARSEVFSDRESATAEASHIIREAEQARRQILEDLARRRSAARRQIEQLRAGRERLVASHETVRRALDDISEELAISMSEARAAANTAGHSVSETTIEELEAEIETARLSGLLDTGPVPVVRSAALPTTSSANVKPATKPEPKKVVDVASEPTPDPAPVEAAEEPDAKDAETKEVAPEEVDPKETARDEVEASDSNTSDGNTSDSNTSDNVVQLDRSRPDVDTKTHPARGRDAATNRSEATEKAGPSTDDEQPVVTGLSIAPDLSEADSSELDDDDSVGDLFASLREPKPATKKKPVAKKKSATKNKKSNASTKKSNGASAKAVASSKAFPAAEPEVDSTNLARRLKRVLADEQSRLMSTLKSMEEMPEPDDILGSVADHRATYWIEVEKAPDVAAVGGSPASDAVDSLIDKIRRRVSRAMVAADGDTDAAVVALRNIYREIKTQQIGETADAVCRSALAKT